MANDWIISKIWTFYHIDEVQHALVQNYRISFEPSPEITNWTRLYHHVCNLPWVQRSSRRQATHRAFIHYRKPWQSSLYLPVRYSPQKECILLHRHYLIDWIISQRPWWSSSSIDESAQVSVRLCSSERRPPPPWLDGVHFWWSSAFYMHRAQWVSQAVKIRLFLYWYANDVLSQVAHNA